MKKPGDRIRSTPSPTRAGVWRALRYPVFSITGLCLLWLAGLIWFATPPAFERRAATTDAIVVLTGGSLRLQSGFELLRAGKGRKLFVSGVNHQVDLDELLRIAGSSRDRALCCVVLGHQADNTLGNARETARWMRSQGFHSLRLVTAWYHMPRSLLEFGRAMPEMAVLAHPVFPGQVRQELWWTRRGTAALLVSEYLKYLVALFRPLFERLQPAEVGMPEPTQAGMRR
ncbi:MAG: YdcF family protein [Alphaproteobacteria bacterium]|nr:YdcF family protein [Alphaproteobacteria bacterium]